jgi:prepilin-type N-terminal cleavage/methylation domain-containing protein
MINSHPHQRRLEDGFTLVELLIAMFLTGIIMAVLFTSFQVFYTNSSYTSGRDDHSAGAEIVATWLNKDLASGTAEAITSNPVRCAGATTKTLQITWYQYGPDSGKPVDDPPVANANPYTVQYDVQTDPNNSGRCMIRRTFTTPAGTPSTLVLARNLAAADFTPSSPSVSCGDAAGPALTATIKQYGTASKQDTSQVYTYQGCLKGRTNGLN